VGGQCCKFSTTGKSPAKSSSPKIKNISLYRNSDLRYVSAQPAPPGGDASRSSRNVGAGCDGRLLRQVIFTRRNVGSVRRSRVVLAPRPWRQVGGKCPAGDGGKTGRSPGRARISRKTIARGKPGCLGCTLSNPCAFFRYSRTRGCGCIQRPAFPAPSLKRGTTKMQSSGEIAP
jgi:hypothetical protein